MIIFCVVSCPPGGLSDQGRNFELKVFQGLCNPIGTAIQRTTTYHPQCDGGEERLICMITKIIAKLAENQKANAQYLLTISNLPKASDQFLKKLVEIEAPVDGLLVSNAKIGVIWSLLYYSYTERAGIVKVVALHTRAFNSV